MLKEADRRTYRVRKDADGKTATEELEYTGRGLLKEKPQPISKGHEDLRKALSSLAVWDIDESKRLPGRFDPESLKPSQEAFITEGREASEEHRVKARHNAALMWVKPDGTVGSRIVEHTATDIVDPESPIGRRIRGFSRIELDKVDHAYIRSKGAVILVKGPGGEFYEVNAEESTKQQERYAADFHDLFSRTNLMVRGWEMIGKPRSLADVDNRALPDIVYVANLMTDPDYAEAAKGYGFWMSERHKRSTGRQLIVAMNHITAPKGEWSWKTQGFERVFGQLSESKGHEEIMTALTSYGRDDSETAQSILKGMVGLQQLAGKSASIGNNDIRDYSRAVWYYLKKLEKEP